MPNPYEENRVGRFKVNRNLLSQNFNLIQQLMSQVIVLNADYDMITDCIKYLAVSEVFEPIPRYCEPILYKVVINNIILGDSNVGTLVVGFQKAEEDSNYGW